MRNITANLLLSERFFILPFCFSVQVGERSCCRLHTRAHGGLPLGLCVIQSSKTLLAGEFWTRWGSQGNRRVRAVRGRGVDRPVPPSCFTPLVKISPCGVHGLPLSSDPSPSPKEEHTRRALPDTGGARCPRWELLGWVESQCANKLILRLSNFSKV